MTALNNALAGLLLAMGLTGVALADTAVENTPYTQSTFGQQADQGSGAYTQAFAMPADITLEAIQWWGFHGVNSLGSGSDQFQVRLGDSLQSGALSSVAVGAGGTEGLFLYTLDLTDAPLTASTLSIVNDSGDVEWFWQSAAAIGNPGQPAGSDVAFRLLGHATPAVPEPGSCALLLLGLAGLGCLRMRR